jgi:molybdopterin molybdotransferase
VISFDEALASVVGAVEAVEAETVPLAAAAGRVLAERISADLDLPPFDTTAMDGWAVPAAAAATAPSCFRAAGTLGAGHPAAPLGDGFALKLMTGAPLPEGSDAVVPVEEASEEADGTVRLLVAPAKGAHVRARGEVIASGETLLSPGRRLSPADLVLAAAAGYEAIRVARRLRAAVLVTGHEVVPAGSRPGPAQIRNTNGPLLRAALARCGAEARDLGTAPDDARALRVILGNALAAGLDLLLTTGGVSAGDFDIVPGVLEELGAVRRFHKVAIKPGKPVYFGTAGPTLVFGLPGNPVSTAVVFDLLVRPALRKATGLSPALPPPVEATLAAAVVNKGPRLFFAPADVAWKGPTLVVTPVPTKGSHDVLAHSRAGGLVVIPPDARLAPGDRVLAHLGTEETTLGAFA